jgi:hypothetical protein
MEDYLMRINYSEDEDYPGQFGLWQANCRRSLSGRSGQAALRELEAALLALPSKRLIAGELNDGKDVCAIGALVRYKRHIPVADPEDQMEEIGVECGMPRLVAWKVVELNDVELMGRYDYSDDPHGRFVPLTPEGRYIAMLKWVRELLN